MSLVLDSVGPPPHLLHSRAESWPCPFDPHPYPASTSPPAPMSPQSLQSYMSHIPESPLPSQEVNHLPTSTWYGPSVSAPDCHNHVSTASVLAKTRHSPITSRVATPHIANICLHIHRQSLFRHPRLPTTTWERNQRQALDSNLPWLPCLLSLSMLGNPCCPTRHARPRSRWQTRLTQWNSDPHDGDQIRTSSSVRTAARAIYIPPHWKPPGR
jgi:hypothetical protein